jgi:predicted nucleotidyltransferase
LNNFELKKMSARKMKKDDILKKLNENHKLLRTHGVKEIHLFGSIARGEADAESDVDLLVEFEPSAHIGMFEFSRLRYKLREILGCRVDLATPEALHKAIKDDILREAIRAA